MEFGTSIPMWLLVNEAANGRSKEIAHVLQRMEDAGFTHFQQGDHIADPGLSHHPDEDLTRVTYSDVFSTFAYLAPLNARLKFLAGVVALPLRHPVLVAHATATLDRLTGGRFILGIGSGYARSEFEAVGVDMKDRFARTEESLQVIISLLEQHSTFHEGRFFRMDGVSITCRPWTIPRPPIWVGGVGAQASLRAARLGDGWFPSISGYKRAPGLSPRKLAEMNSIVQIRRRELGKPPLPVFASSAIAFSFMTDPRPLEGPADVRDRSVNGSGTARDLAELLSAYKQAGVKGFMLNCHTETSLDGCLRAVDTFANQIKPHIF